MIQELLGISGTSGLIRGEEKSSKFTNTTTTAGGGGGLIIYDTPSSSPSSSPSISSSSSSATNSTTSSTAENLRCPRCDSSNTKFCYYNNYNLTQPRHFCKTCRRYWTKGGALRNVPIGGGCRKNKNTSVTTSLGKPSSGKFKTLSSELVGKSSLFEHDHLSSNPILWSTPQNSHFLSLLRISPNPNNSNPNLNLNPSPNPSPNHVMNSGSSQMSSEPPFGSLDSFTQILPSIGLLNNNNSTLWKNNQPNQVNGNFMQIGEVQNNGLQELYQRLKSSTNCNGVSSDHAPLLFRGNVSATTSSLASSTILESAPVSGGDQLGIWNTSSALSWSANGAYP